MCNSNADSITRIKQKMEWAKKNWWAISPEMVIKICEIRTVTGDRD